MTDHVQICKNLIQKYESNQIDLEVCQMQILELLKDSNFITGYSTDRIFEIIGSVFPSARFLSMAIKAASFVSPNALVKLAENYPHTPVIEAILNKENLNENTFNKLQTSPNTKWYFEEKGISNASFERRNLNKIIGESNVSKLISSLVDKCLINPDDKSLLTIMKNLLSTSEDAEETLKYLLSKDLKDTQEIVLKLIDGDDVYLGKVRFLKQLAQHVDSNDIQGPIRKKLIECPISYDQIMLEKLKLGEIIENPISVSEFIKKIESNTSSAEVSEMIKNHSQLIDNDFVLKAIFENKNINDETAEDCFKLLIKRNKLKDIKRDGIIAIADRFDRLPNKELFYKELEKNRGLFVDLVYANKIDPNLVSKQFLTSEPIYSYLSRDILEKIKDVDTLKTFIDQANLHGRRHIIKNVLLSTTSENQDILTNYIADKFLRDEQSPHGLSIHFLFVGDNEEKIKLKPETLKKLLNFSQNEHELGYILSNKNFPEELIEEVILSKADYLPGILDIFYSNNPKTFRKLQKSNINIIRKAAQKIYDSYNEKFSEHITEIFKNAIKGSVASSANDVFFEATRFALSKANVPKQLLENPVFNHSLKMFMPFLMVYISTNYYDEISEACGWSIADTGSDIAKLMLTEVGANSLKPFMSEIILPVIKSMIGTGQLKELTSSSEPTKMLKE